METKHRQSTERLLDRIDKNIEDSYSPAVVVFTENKFIYTCTGGYIYKVVCIVKGDIDMTKTDTNIVHRDGPGLDCKKMATGVISMLPWMELEIRATTFTGNDATGVFALYVTPGTKIVTS